MKRFALVGKDIKKVLAQQYTHIALMYLVLMQNMKL